MQVGGNSTEPLDIWWEHSQISFLLNLFQSFIKASQKSKSIEALKDSFRKIPLPWQGIDPFTVNLGAFHVMSIINDIDQRLRGLIAKLFGNCTIRCNFSRKGVKLFLVVRKSEILSFLITLIPILVIDFDGDLDFPSSVLLLLNSDYSWIVPTSKGVDYVNQITNFDVFSPFEGGAFWLVRGQVIWIALDFYRRKFVVQIIRYNEMGFIQFDDSTMSPEILLVWSRKPHNVDFAAFLEKHLEIVVLFGKIQVWLRNNRRNT